MHINAVKNQALEDISVPNVVLQKILTIQQIHLHHVADVKIVTLQKNNKKVLK